jgi:hypothetical protein
MQLVPLSYLSRAPKHPDANIKHEYAGNPRELNYPYLYEHVYALQKLLVDPFRFTFITHQIRHSLAPPVLDTPNRNEQN